MRGQGVKLMPVADGVLGEVDGFRVRMVTMGMRYGLEDCLTNTFGEPLLEFYAKEGAALGSRGQFIARFLLSSLLDRQGACDLRLDPQEPQWVLSAEGLRQAITWATGVVPMVRNFMGFWRVSFAA